MNEVLWIILGVLLCFLVINRQVNHKVRDPSYGDSSTHNGDDLRRRLQTLLPSNGGSCSNGFVSRAVMYQNQKTFFCLPSTLKCGPGNGILFQASGPTCQNCPSQHFCQDGWCLGTGLESSEFCQPCVNETFADSPGASVCTVSPQNITSPCPPGTGIVPNNLLRGCFNCSDDPPLFNNGSSIRCQSCQQFISPNIMLAKQSGLFNSSWGRSLQLMTMVPNLQRDACIVPLCPAGFFRRENSVLSLCEACRPGTTSPPGFVSPTGCQISNLSSCGPGQRMSTRRVCMPCGIDSYSVNGRAPMAARCTPCPNGLFASQPGAVYCTPPIPYVGFCPPGSGRIEGTSGCYNCSASQFSDGQSRNQQTLCIPCREGFVSNPGHTNCSIPICGPGMEIVKSNTCQSCKPGYAVAPRGSSLYIQQNGQCIRTPSNVECDPGSGLVFSPTRSTTPTCLLCPENTFCPNGRCYTTSMTESPCTPCPNGLSAGDQGAAKCTRIPSSTEPCPPGSGVSDTATGCYNCPPTHFNRGNSNRCQPCPPDMQANANGTMCVVAPCETGFYRKTNSVDSPCTRCNRGSASPFGYVNDSCIESTICGMGQSPLLNISLQIMTSRGDSPCVACPIDQYCLSGQCARRISTGLVISGCRSCPDGTSATQTGAVQCTRSDRLGNEGCPPGSGRRQFAQGCYNCTGVTFNPGNRTLCIPCPTNRLSNAERTNCSTCIRGMQEGANGCVDCEAGFVSSRTNHKCHLSPLGHDCGGGMALLNRLDGSACIQCPPNQYCTLGRCEMVTSQDCNPCPPGTFATFPGASRCTPRDGLFTCPPGTGISPGNDGCYNCTSNTYNDGTNNICRPCRPGYIPDPSRSTCVVPDCPPGFFREKSNSSFPCQPCAPGTVSPWGLVSSTGCYRFANTLSLLCGPGQSPAEINGRMMCLSCQAATFCTNGRCMFNSTVFGCAPCRNGDFSSFPGAAQCTLEEKVSSSPCVKGTGRRISGAGCYNCTGDTYNDGSFIFCRDCPFRYPPIRDFTACSPKETCLAGEVSQNGSCVPCGANEASEAGSPNGCVRVNLQCAPGQAILFRPGSSICQSCPEDTFCTNGRCLTTKSQNPTRGCNPCKQDNKADGPSAVQCTPADITIKTTCPIGSGLAPYPHFRGCYRCNYLSINNVGTQDTCTPCPASKVANDARTACISQPCIAGTFGTPGSCRPCPKFTASPDSALSCTSITEHFKGCLPGQMVVQVSTSPHRYVCEDCAPGTYCPNGRCLVYGGISTVNKKVTVASTTGCPVCPSGTESTGFGAVSCASPNTRYNGSWSMTTTSRGFRCTQGSGMINQNIGCYRCPTSRYNNGSLAVCLRCPTGSMADLSTDPPNQRCIRTCPSGSGYGGRMYRKEDDDASLCVLCKEGYYNDGSSWLCKQCSLTEYSIAGSSSCSPCSWPYKSAIIKGVYISCNLPVKSGRVVNLNLDWVGVYVISTVCAFLYILILGFIYFRSSDDVVSDWENHHTRKWTIPNIIGIMVITALPFLDALTDVLFVTHADVISLEILITVCMLPLVQMILFLHHLSVINAVPRLPIPIPQFVLVFQTYDQFYKVALTALLSLPWLIINSPFLFLWLIFGFFLYVCKLMFVGKVERMWLQVWTGKDYRNLPFLNHRFANTIISGKLLLETIPQFVVQVINVQQLNEWNSKSGINIISLAFSLLNTVSGAYRLLHAKLYGRGSFTSAPIEIRLFSMELLYISDKLSPEDQVKVYYKTDDDDGDVGNTGQYNNNTNSTNNINNIKSNQVTQGKDDKVSWQESPLSVKARLSTPGNIKPINQPDHVDRKEDGI